MTTRRAPPRSLDSLRLAARSNLDRIPPEHFTVEIWLKVVSAAFRTADGKWAQAQLEADNQQLAEEAYVEYRRGGEILNKVKDHPQFARMRSSQSQEYFAYQRLKEVRSLSHPHSDPRNSLYSHSPLWHCCSQFSRR